MKYFNYLLVGLMLVMSKTDYSDIKEYLASWALALMLEIHLIIFLAIAGLKMVLISVVVVVSYIALVGIIIAYYKFNKIKIEKLYANLTESEISVYGTIAIIFIFETVALPLIYSFVKN